MSIIGTDKGTIHLPKNVAPPDPFFEKDLAAGVTESAQQILQKSPVQHKKGATLDVGRSSPIKREASVDFERADELIGSPKGSA